MPPAYDVIGKKKKKRKRKKEHSGRMGSRVRAGTWAMPERDGIHVWKIGVRLCLIRVGRGTLSKYIAGVKKQAGRYTEYN